MLIRIIDNRKNIINEPRSYLIGQDGYIYFVENGREVRFENIGFWEVKDNTLYIYGDNDENLNLR